MLKKIMLLLIGVFIILQFFRPDKNDSNDLTHHISNNYDIPIEVNQLLKTSCNDCHSNKTRYPWYSKIQPAAWWMNDHIKHGKGHLNFSEFTNLSIAVQNHKFEEIVEMIEEHEMPLPSYTYLGLHKEAKLSDAQRKQLIDWAKGEMGNLKSKYPADSLIMKRRRK